jgi:hypothetical protein
MSTHKPKDPVNGSGHDAASEAQPVDASKGYEGSDVQVIGIVGVMIAFGLFAAVSAILAYGVGKVLNQTIARWDGPPNQWAHSVDVRPLGNMANNPDMQNKVGEATQHFPTPRLQTDDGMQDLADLHTREDLLLDNYSWADREHGKVRIPIARAMALIAQRGLPMAPQIEREPLMTGDSDHTVAAPLTNGFTHTGFESDEAQAKAIRGKQAETKQ